MDSVRAGRGHRSKTLYFWAEGIARSDLCRPLGGHRYQLTVTQTELSRRLGYGPKSGALSRRLGRLLADGIVESRTPVVFNLSGGAQPTPDCESSRADHHHAERDRQAHNRPLGHPGWPEALSTSSPEALIVRVLALAEHHRHPDVSFKALDVVLCILEMASNRERATNGAPGRATTREDRPPASTTRRTPTAPATPTASADSADPVPAVLAPDHYDAHYDACRAVTDGDVPETSDAEKQRAEARNPPQGRATAEPHDQQGHADADRVGSQEAEPGEANDVLEALGPRTDREVLDLIGPLIVECHKRNLGGLTSLTGLRAALSTCSDEEVKRGVAAICRHLSCGSRIHSPIGLLCVLGRTNDLHLLAETELPDGVDQLALERLDAGTHEDATSGIDAAADGATGDMGTRPGRGDAWLTAVRQHLENLNGDAGQHDDPQVKCHTDT